MTNVELNERMNVSQSYLTKITRKLVIAGIITSAQGVKGGFILARPMTSITLGDVVKATDGSAPFFRPTNLIKQAFPAREYITRKGVKLLHDAFTQAEQKWFDELNLTTMEQLISKAKTTR
ncbi:hypothetical protein BGO17_04395 [Candidatus Saccharibacteria bacterium 49-20]|nr:MAG: hypothetical protein BGO17_04395 [Candidatus Saccharibacteria bacterium 49-20]